MGLLDSILIMSPSFNVLEGFAQLLLTKTRPLSETSFATVLLLINLETFKNLSRRNVILLSYIYNSALQFLFTIL